MESFTIIAYIKRFISECRISWHSKLKQYRCVLAFWQHTWFQWSFHTPKHEKRLLWRAQTSRLKHFVKFPRPLPFVRVLTLTFFPFISITSRIWILSIVFPHFCYAWQEIQTVCQKLSNAIYCISSLTVNNWETHYTRRHISFSCTISMPVL